MQNAACLLAGLGAAIAAPAFLINFAWHDWHLPGPEVEELDRMDGVFSFMLMTGVALIVAALYLVRPSPLGRVGRYLLVVEAAMVVLAAIWSAVLIVDTQYVVDNESMLLLALGDASWPLHQLFMLAIGIAALRHGQWPSPSRYALFGPVAGVVILLIAAASEADVVVAISIGLGWAIAGAGVILATRDEPMTDIATLRLDEAVTAGT